MDFFQLRRVGDRILSPFFYQNLNDPTTVLIYHAISIRSVHKENTTPELRVESAHTTNIFEKNNTVPWKLALNQALNGPQCDRR